MHPRELLRYLLTGWFYDLVASHQGLEVGPLHVHVDGGPRDVPIVALEGGEHETAFDVLDRFLARFLLAFLEFLAGAGSDGGRRGLRAADLQGQVGRRDGRDDAEHADAVHHVLEFPHVAGPRVVQESVQRLGGDRGNLTAAFFTELLEKVRGEGRDIFFPSRSGGSVIGTILRR